MEKAFDLSASDGEAGEREMNVDLVAVVID